MARKLVIATSGYTITPASPGWAPLTPRQLETLTIEVDAYNRRLQRMCQGGCGAAATACDCPPPAQRTLDLVLHRRQAEGKLTGPTLAALPAGRPAPRNVCSTCHAVQCRCGVPAPPTLENVLQYQKAHRRGR